MAVSTVRFGLDSWLRGTGQGAMASAITLAAIVRRVGNTSLYEAFLGGATSLNAQSFMFAYDTGLGSNPKRLTLWDGTNNRFSTTTFAPTDSDWYLFAVTKATGAATPTFHGKNLTRGTGWFHEAGVGTNTLPSVAGGYLKIGNYDLTPGDPGSANEDFLGDVALVGWWDGTELSNAQVEALARNGRTSDWWRNAAGPPSSLTELTSLTPTDLAGVMTWVNTAATLTGGDAPWGFDGTGLATSEGFTSNFAVDKTTGAALTTTNATDAEFYSGFLRSPSGKLVVATSGTVRRGGFLRATNGALVIETDGTVANSWGGFPRNAAGALVVTASPGVKRHGGLMRDAAGRVVVS